MFLQHLQHIAIADARAQKRHAEPRDRLFDAVVGHQRAHHRALEPASRNEILRKQIDDVVAVDERTIVIDELYAIAIAVEGNTEVGTLIEYRLAQCRRMRRTAVGVDVEAIRLRADRYDIGTEIGK